MYAMLATAAALSLAGGIAQFRATRAAGEAQKDAAKYAATLAGREATQMEQQAGQQRAVSQRAAMEQRRIGRYAESRARAVTAAGGGMATDPTVLDVYADIDREAEIRALYAMYGGEEAARGLEYGATLKRAGAEGILWQGDVAKKLANAQANLQLLSAGAQTAALGARAYDAWNPVSSTIADEGSGLMGKYGSYDEFTGKYKSYGHT